MGVPILNLCLFTLFFTSIYAHNITEILSAYPEYSEYNKFLTDTKLADDINSRQTITVLVLTNGAMDSLAANHPLSVVKNALSLHVVLDYFDGSKLHGISNGTTLSTTLYQTTGNAPGNLGFVNITDLQGGKVGFGSAAPGSPLDSSYVKSVQQIPYNISVVEISAPIIAPGVLTAPAPSASDVNITALLEKAGCKTFANLIMQSGVLKVYQSAADEGLTIFAPSDEAFKAPKLPDLSKLTNAELVSLLLYHATASYNPTGSLKTQKDPLPTLATNGAAKYDLSVTSAGDTVTLDTGVDSSRLSSTVLDSTPLCIFTVDGLLLPSELFGKSPSPAPAPAPETSPSPAPLAPAPAPESRLAPSPLLSPSATPTSSPVGSPVGSPSKSPTADSQNSTADKNAAAHVKFPALVTILLTVSVSLIVSTFVS